MANGLPITSGFSKMTNYVPQVYLAIVRTITLETDQGDIYSSVP